MQLSLNDPTAFSVQAVMQAGNGSIVFPLVQGMGFVTGIYSNLTPMLQTGIFFRAVEKAGTVNGMTKYRITLEDSKIWLLYATGDVTFNLIGNGKIEGPANFSGIVQLAKTPKDSRTAESLYDSAAGTFALGRTLSGSIDGSTGNYNLSHQKQGNGPLLMFALPHHVQSITGAQVTDIQLQTTTKGIATAVIGDIWNLRENDLPVSMGFEPWSVSGGTHVTTDTNTFSIMAASAASETGQDINGQTNLDSMYFSGKGLSKFAALAWTIHDVLKDGNLASVALQKLKDAFAVFAENRQKYPLVYETAWKSLVSTAAYVTGDAGADFGNTWENDHHFHYAYFVHAAAIIGYLDSGWLAANREYVNSLVRDVSNPSTADPFFPVFRSFDWYSGHSWAKGLFESGDGKDEESTSEDALFSYALKMWGRVSGDANMEARGNLMLAVQRRSFNNYFLMSANNNVQPRQFIGNKAAGITFDNKIGTSQLTVRR